MSSSRFIADDADDYPKQLRRFLLGIFVMLPALCIIAFCGIVSWPGYSESRWGFGPEIDVIEILERRVPFTAHGCGYTVVRFSERTAESLRHQGPKALMETSDFEWTHRSDWAETPISFDPYDGRRDTIHCLDQMAPETKTEIMTLLKQPDNYEAGGGYTGLAILSASNRIAVHIKVQ